ncbi:MAG: FAD-dependent oxidoreductase [Herminiimonas sp.]|uniref:NAD(P)/FAD-dependent oxidoreductase n=1 Tax=Herminiimonas sp. TaxID=1926289 RepID=UPI002728F86A|nr:FAD-dependent oxidoreductase [Herminiimonas sp.]MDO9420434.1 FAD-dependent oxidoreductase [Herminiimonas sp.]
MKMGIKIAVAGSGIAGLSCAYRLAEAGYDVTLFEANDYFGGHTHTVDVTLDGYTHGVDTGFLVFNKKTYPNLIALFAELKVETAATDMSFSVKLPLANRTLEWAGGNLDAVFAQRRNIVSPRFHQMLRDILRFNQNATKLAMDEESSFELQTESGQEMSLGTYLTQQSYSKEFREWYLLPMAGCIWSCPTEQMLEFPLKSFLHFCHNHGLLQINDRPQWQTVRGGARRYVDKMLAKIPNKHLNTSIESVTRTTISNVTKIKVQTRLGNALSEQTFDHIVLACHSDQSLRALKDPRPAEKTLLSSITYQPNTAVLHTDTTCLPKQKKTWSAWNYQSGQSGSEPRVCVHYLINQLQPLPFKQSVIVSLNPIDAPRPDSVLGSYEYAHPVFDAKAIAAQRRLPLIQGKQNTWFAGAWTGYGFHEDGLKSGLAVAQAIMEQAEEFAIYAPRVLESA